MPVLTDCTVQILEKKVIIEIETYWVLYSLLTVVTFFFFFGYRDHLVREGCLQLSLWVKGKLAEWRKTQWQSVPNTFECACPWGWETRVTDPDPCILCVTALLAGIVAELMLPYFPVPESAFWSVCYLLSRVQYYCRGWHRPNKLEDNEH